MNRIEEVRMREESSPLGVREFFMQRKTGNYKSLVANAVNYSDEHGRLPMFALDKATENNPMAKTFFCGTYQDFYMHYISQKKETRCFYETILDEYPCHLYFDLEYPKCDSNMHVNEAKLEKDFKEEYRQLFKDEYGIASEDISEVVLDSSNEKKYSKHIIVKIKGKRFKNNYHCGAFVRKLRNRILEKYGGNMLDNVFFLRSKEKHKIEKYDITFFADLGVYTMNRQWRLYKSTKAGQNRFLLLEGERDTDVDVVDKEKFFMCLVQRITEEEVSDLEFIICLEEDGSEPVSTSNKYSFLPIGVPYDPFSKNKDELIITQKKKKKGAANLDREYVPSDVLDPVAQIAIANAIKLGWARIGDVGSLTFIHYSREFQTVRYESSSKDCKLQKAIFLAAGKTPRDHKSNHVFFRVYLNRYTFVQCCHDVDCFPPNTQEYPLPDTVREIVAEIVNDKKQAENIALSNSFIKASQYMVAIDKKKFFD